MGWVKYPVCCPSCGKRVRENAIITHGGAVRCDRGCKGLLYVLPARQHGAVFVVEVSDTEAQEILSRGLNLPDTLDYLGALFPKAA